MSEISQELVERMVALVRELHADHVKYGAVDIEQNFVARTAEIVALLPKPVDPDLVEARDIAFHSRMDGQPDGPWKPDLRREMAGGKRDIDQDVQCALLGIKRGRQMESTK